MLHLKKMEKEYGAAEDYYNAGLNACRQNDSKAASRLFANAAALDDRNRKFKRASLFVGPNCISSNDFCKVALENYKEEKVLAALDLAGIAVDLDGSNEKAKKFLKKNNKHFEAIKNKLANL